MSVAFVREESAEAAQEVSLPPRAISPHPNPVTQSGLRALEQVEGKRDRFHQPRVSPGAGAGTGEVEGDETQGDAHRAREPREGIGAHQAVGRHRDPLPVVVDRPPPVGLDRRHDGPTLGVIELGADGPVGSDAHFEGDDLLVDVDRAGKAVAGQRARRELGPLSEGSGESGVGRALGGRPLLPARSRR